MNNKHILDKLLKIALKQQNIIYKLSESSKLSTQQSKTINFQELFSALDSVINDRFINWKLIFSDDKYGSAKDAYSKAKNYIFNNQNNYTNIKDALYHLMKKSEEHGRVAFSLYQQQQQQSTSQKEQYKVTYKNLSNLYSISKKIYDLI